MPTLRIAARAAPSIVLAASAHLALLLWLALFRFPWLALRSARLDSAGPSVVASALVHALVLVALARLAGEGERRTAMPQAELLVGLAEDDPNAPTIAQPQQAAGDSNGGTTSGSSEAVVIGGDPGEPMRLEAIELSDLHIESSARGRSLFDGQGLGFGGQLGREVGGFGKGGDAKAKGSADFFGVTAGGNDFVFVVDMSGSMKGSRWRRARNELRRSIESLGETQRFFIVLYSTEAYPMPTKGLLEATQRNVGDAVHWLNKVDPEGSTNPLPAVMMALELKPDAIFLLSDGDFSPAMAMQISAFQTRPLPIHTIGFESRVGERVLKLIADQTQGTYRFVR